MARMIILISLRNLLAHKAGSLIVGSIIFFGTFLVVLGSSMLDSINASMAKSITSSVAGHLQVYSAEAKDDLALFGGGFVGGDDFGIIDDFGRVRRALEAVPNVAAVIPMGIKSTLVIRGNEIDLTLASLRAASLAGDVGRERELRRKLDNITADLVTDLENRLPIAADRDKILAGLADLSRSRSPEFWREFEADKEKGLLYLDTHLAPLAEDGTIYYLRNLGTDIQRFAQYFDRFELVDGQLIPPGERGMLLSTRFNERWGKHRVARQIDRIAKNREQFGATFATDPKLKEIARMLPRQYQRIKSELSATNAARLETDLRQLLPNIKGDLNALLQEFLTLNDDNFERRRQFFYDVVAPMIRIYALGVGEEIAVRTVTKSGYLKATKIKVWGTYRFKSLEDSDLAGAQNLVDMLTFRELYGVMTEAKKAELAAIRQSVGIANIARADAEDTLFGGADAALVEDSGPGARFNADDVLGAAAGDAAAPRFTEADIDNGLAINAAVVLTDPEQLWTTKAAIEKVVADTGLGLKVVDWQTASGIIGQFILVLRVVLYIAIIITFIVALVIINNSMVMATLERTPEIGTMRAMGAQRRFVAGLFLVETAVLGFIAGTLGGLSGIVVMSLLGHYGLPAPNEQIVFLFSGPRLYPTIGASSVLLSFAAVLGVSLASTLYPAAIAASIQPVVAMQAKE